MILIGKPFAEHTADSFYDYCISLINVNHGKRNVKSKKAKEFRAVSMTVNVKGQIRFSVKRSPKRIEKKEIVALSKEHSISEAKLWNLLKKRNIEIVDSIDKKFNLQNAIDNKAF